MSIKRQMILYFSGLMIVIFVLTECINGYQAYGLLEENLTSSITEALDLGVKSMDSYFEDAENVCSSIMADQQTQDMMRQEIGEDLDGRILARELNKVITQYASTHPYITKVYLLDRSGNILTPELRGEDIGAYIGGGDGRSTLEISRLHDARYIGGSVTKVFSLVKPIFAYNDRENQIGTIVADVDYRILMNVVGDHGLPMNGTMVLSDGHGTVLQLKEGDKVTWDSGGSLSGEGLPDDRTIAVDGKKYMNISQQSPVTGLKLSALIPRDEFIRSVFSQMWLSFLLLGLCLAVIVAVTRKIIRAIYQPLNLLGESMKKIEAGDFDTCISYDRQDEFSALIGGYNLMVVKIKMLLDEVVQKEKTRRNAELYALQAQINPHFLYNTLNSIRYFAKVYQSPEIREMTTALIQLSKASLSSEKYISIRREMELTKYYLAIQRLRYGDIFEVDTQIEEAVEDCLIPRFSIQPMVENALFHGILPRGSGLIRICIEGKDQGISIRIQDDGIGMEREELEKLNERLQYPLLPDNRKEEISKLKNIGLENISYRIRMYYGDAGKVGLSAGNPGIQVKIWIPRQIRQQEKDSRPGGRPEAGTLAGQGEGQEQED